MIKSSESKKYLTAKKVLKKIYILYIKYIEIIKLPKSLPFSKILYK